MSRIQVTQLSCLTLNSHVLREENVSLQRIIAIRNKYEAVILRTSLGIVNFLANYYERITFGPLLQSTISIMSSPINDFLFSDLVLIVKVNIMRYTAFYK